MIRGTLVYGAADAERLARAFGRKRALAFWQAGAIAVLLGAAIGLGGSILLGRILGLDLKVGSAESAWGTAIGIAVFVVAAARWIETKRPTAPSMPQALALDTDGLALQTETARTTLGWRHFVRHEIAEDAIVLEGRDGLFVLLRPAHFANTADWQAARALVAAQISAVS